MFIAENVVKLCIDINFTPEMRLLGCLDLTQHILDRQATVLSIINKYSKFESECDAYIISSTQTTVYYTYILVSRINGTHNQRSITNTNLSTTNISNDIIIVKARITDFNEFKSNFETHKN